MKNSLVEVEWLDPAHSATGWEPPDVYTKRGPAHCVSVGYVLRHDRQQLTIVQSLGRSTGEVTDALIIPRGCIVRVRRLTYRTRGT